MTNKELTPAKAGELRADGTFVVNVLELPGGWQETHRVARLKIRGEKEPRKINYNDYAKLLTFYNAQERLIKDRKHVMVTLSDGLIVNTADITSLEPQDEQHWTPKIAEVPEDTKKLPTTELLLDTSGKILALTVTRKKTQELGSQQYLAAKCHYREKPDGTRDYLTKLDQIPDAFMYRNAEDPNYPPILVQQFKYGIPQL
ncbi:MAG: hypothetical protein IIY54_00210 [Ruminococcus sp.]|nr:hypothetical protein [Ruminococcus sp.]